MAAVADGPAVRGVDEVAFHSTLVTRETQSHPGVATVCGPKDGAVVGGDPAVRGIDEADVVESIGKVLGRSLVEPRSAAVVGGEDGVAAGPAVLGVDKAHRPQIGIAAGRPRRPRGAGVAAVQDQSSDAHRPDVLSGGECHVAQAGRAAGGLWHLPEPAVGAVGYESCSRPGQTREHDERPQHDADEHATASHHDPFARTI